MVATYFYCTCGAQTIGSQAHIPFEVLELFASCTETVLAHAEIHEPPAGLSKAHAAVLEHFAVDPRAFARLTAQDIIAFKSDGALRQALTTLRELVDSVESEWPAEELLSSRNWTDAQKCRDEIYIRVREYCLKKHKRAEIAQLGGVTVEDGVLFGSAALEGAIPFSGLLRRGVLRVGRAIARKHPS